MTKARRLSRLFVSILAAAPSATLASPPQAGAATVGFAFQQAGDSSHNSLTYRARPGEVNHVTVVGSFQREPGPTVHTVYAVKDARAPLLAARGCQRAPGPRSLTCGRGVATPGYPRVLLGDGNDRVGVYGAPIPRGEETSFGNDPFNYTISGGPGNDAIVFGPNASGLARGEAGTDYILGGPAPDRIGGGPGSDIINVLGGGRDIVACGAGVDGVRADPSDRLLGCERVSRS